MRLGEIKSKLSEVITTDNLIIIQVESLYQGQVYKINNLEQIVEAIEVIKDQKWNNVSYDLVSNIVLKVLKNQYSNNELSPEEYQNLNTYISQVNSYIPQFYSILTATTNKQDEWAINIKIPEKDVKSFAKLSEFNKKTDLLLKKFNIDGQFDFVGFDTGSAWYVVVAMAPMSYAFLIGCLKIAQEALKTKKLYYEGEKAEIEFKKAEIEYQSALKVNKTSDAEIEATKDQIDKYIQNKIDFEMENKIKKIVHEIGHGSKTEDEVITQIMIGTKNLIKDMEEGTEFHLSLNPPEYAKETSKGLTIDYSKLSLITKASETKALTSASKLT